MMNLKGHAALVTGGTQGVGAAIACQLAKCGADLVVHGLCTDDSARKTQEMCRAFGVQCELLEFDLGRPVDEILEGLGHEACRLLAQPIDLLVSNAGIYIDKPFLEMDEATFAKTFHINVTSGYFLTQFFARRWVHQGVRGRVLFTGSINGLLAESDHSSYDASKGAVAAMVRSLCVALAPMGIRVNSMAPGLVRSPLTNQVLSRDPEALRWMQWHTPNGQVPEAEVCGPMAAFLLSDEAEHVHGQTIYVDGGMSSWQQPDLPTALRGKT
jgi:NAD(P)-dependent dehydrogenase (short-subunit alcohol dehydrogenase family)